MKKIKGKRKRKREGKNNRERSGGEQVKCRMRGTERNHVERKQKWNAEREWEWVEHSERKER